MDLTEKIRQQFDSLPYPQVPLEQSPLDDPNLLFIHSLMTPFYLRSQTIPDTQNTAILDVGCGSGYKSLALAVANPQSVVIGIDLSEPSLEVARVRAQTQGIGNAEFHLLAISDLPQLGRNFDYINCDETLYLFRDIGEGFQLLRSVLKPEGIIRANLHSAYQRATYFRAQELFKQLGLMAANPGELEVQIVADTLKSLKPDVNLAKTWTKDPFEPEGTINSSAVLMNFLFQGDKGYTIPDLFDALRQADLELISMVNWREWDLLSLFQNPEDLPLFWEITLPELSDEMHLTLFELISPQHRLLDFWCGYAGQRKPYRPLNDWSRAEWEQAHIHLHPVLSTPRARADLVDSIQAQQPWEVSRYLSTTIKTPCQVESHLAACLLPLWDAPQTIQSLIDRRLQTCPNDLVTLVPLSEEQAFEQLKALLMRLETFLYVLVEW
ncbi:class I SAM-dependent methyltransferase [Leptothermofonsia sichuanensis E412]|uniref:class I SAM-dependent methyltransferase n=1 Tax=Leptothermofonsia sichuanensis TaxID=2917832 RepID=UPI001CA69D85|nr:class I SAM-dependent methyltransferase [Leptothermofonsia sichuanensis]QZZ20178.1 class I SAM-dependent methyltransferase [Leptothermofonsia sichuanensis E412]